MGLTLRCSINYDEFFTAFYAGSELPQNIVTRLRAALEESTGDELRGLHPRDNLLYAFCELDLADLAYRIKRDLDVVVTREMIDMPEVTFDYLVKCIAGVSQSTTEMPHPTASANSP